MTNEVAINACKAQKLLWVYVYVLLKQPHSLRSVIKLHLLFAHAFTCFGFLVNHLQKAHELFKGNYHYMIHSYIK
jgi:hypothetical protein